MFMLNSYMLLNQTILRLIKGYPFINQKTFMRMRFCYIDGIFLGKYVAKIWVGLMILGKHFKQHIS